MVSEVGFKSSPFVEESDRLGRGQSRCNVLLFPQFVGNGSYCLRMVVHLLTVDLLNQKIFQVLI